MAKAIYTAEANVTGGRAEGHGATTDGALDVQLRLPPEMGGPPTPPTPTTGGATNPEQLFAIGFAACFEGAIGVVGRRARAEVGDVSILSKVSLHPLEGGGFGLSASLDVSLPQVTDPALAKQIVSDAHAVCPYSNATRGNIEVALSANGQPI